MKKTILNFVYAAFVSAFMLLLFLFLPTHVVEAEENLLELPIRQEIRVDSPYAKPREQVSYRLEALDQAPLPEGASGNYDFGIRGEGSYMLRFQNIPKGSYRYKLYQLPLDQKSSLLMDERSYMIRLEVFQSPDGVVIQPFLSDEQQHKPEVLRFINRVQVTNVVGQGRRDRPSFQQESLGRRTSSHPKTGDPSELSRLLFIMTTGTLILFLLMTRKKKEENNFAK